VIEFIEGEVKELDVQLIPIAGIPTEWTEGVVVREIKVEPSLAYIGETVNIKVYVEYPWPEFEGVHINGEIMVDGQIMKGSIDAPETIMRFEYPATLIGNYTVRAQDKSAHFQVEQSTQGTYYSPWGNKRYPIFTEMIIPDVNPFTVTYGGQIIYEHPGGDLKLAPLGENRFSFMLRGEGGRLDFLCKVPDIIKDVGSWDQVALAYPSKWDPAEAIIYEFEKELKTYGFQVRCYYFEVRATDYDCIPYWYSLDALAEFLAKFIGFANEISALMGFHEICGAGMCTPSVQDPYSDEKIEGAPHTRGAAWDKISFVRSVLSIIAQRHPEYPLNEPPPGF
jgi:hypothetical protein